MANAVDKIATYVLLDLEATGLPGIGETPRIVEMSLIAVQRKHLQEQKSGCPRIMDKLVVCLNPGGKPMSCGASFITGIYNDELEDLAVFDDRVVYMLTLFLERLPQPVCLLAHNGNKFDFPMLQMELERINGKLPVGVLCGDTLEALRVIDPQHKGQHQNVQAGTTVVAAYGTASQSTCMSTSVTSSVRGGVTSNSVGNGALNDEITPVKPSENGKSCFANPPPAPRKRRNCPDGARNLGNMHTAKRRLLQDDVEGGGNMSARASQLGSCVASPPPSPQAPRKSVAKRKLSFSDAHSNSSGDATPVSASASALARLRFNPEDSSEIADEELLPFPDDFSDSEGDKQDDPENSEKDLDAEEVNDDPGNGVDVENSDRPTCIGTNVTETSDKLDTNKEITEQDLDMNLNTFGVVSTSTLSNNVSRSISFSQSLPDNELIAEVDQLVSNASNQSASDADTQGTKGCHSDQNGANNVSNSSDSENVVVANSDIMPVSVAADNSDSHVVLSTDIYCGQRTPTRQEQPAVVRMSEESTCLSKDAKNQANQRKQDLMSGESCVSVCDGNISNVNRTNVACTPLFSQTLRKSFKLIEIYKRIFGKYPQVSHAAEDDCITLLKIIQTCASKFSEWMDANAIPFSNIKKMY